MYSTTIKYNLLTKVIIFGDESYIEMLIFLHSKHWYQKGIKFAIVTFIQIQNKNLEL